MVIRLNPFFSSILLNQIQQQQRDESDEEEINQEENPFLNLINNTLSEVIEERQRGSNTTVNGRNLSLINSNKVFFYYKWKLIMLTQCQNT